MRKVARYSFWLETQNIEPPQPWEGMLGCVDSWLTAKGPRTEANGVTLITLRGDREGTLAASNFAGEGHEVWKWTLEEATDGGVFRTTLAIGRTADNIAVSCELEAGARGSLLAPVFFDARCPQVLRDIIGLGYSWRVGATSIAATPIRFDGRDGENHLGRLIQDRDRSLPLVVVSEEQGLVLHPGIADALARDLAGVAIVAAASTAASWILTKELGVDWSCYNGAIRLYWPLSSVGEEPRKHPLWTPRRLLYGLPDTGDAANRIRNQLRRRLLGLSTLTLRRHSLFDAAEQAERTQLLEQRRREAPSDRDLLVLYEQENERLNAENRNLREKVVHLEADLANTQAQLEWSKHESVDEIAPDDEVPPATVDEAVARAKSKYESLLTFGDDVDRGVTRLAADAGPPDKILEYLRGLSELATALRQGPLGTTSVKWLEQHGFHVSGESDTRKTNKSAKKLRTWHDGAKRREFELHMKPSDATSPDRCVRIYFDWDQSLQTVVVAWIGRKPGL